MNDPYKKYVTPHEKHLQIIYLREVDKWTPTQIAKIVDYTLATIRSYFYKFRNLLKEAKAFFKDVAANTLKKAEETSAYVIEFYYPNNKRAFLKIGMTTRKVEVRAKEYLKQWNSKHEQQLAYYSIRYVIPCGRSDDDAQTMENALRKHYKQSDPAGYTPRDRFKNAIFSKTELLADAFIAQQYELLGYGALA